MKYIYFVSFSYTENEKIEFWRLEVPVNEPIDNISSISKMEDYIQDVMLKNADITTYVSIINYQLLRTEN